MGRGGKEEGGKGNSQKHKEGSIRFMEYENAFSCRTSEIQGFDDSERDKSVKRMISLSLMSCVCLKYREGSRHRANPSIGHIKTYFFLLFIILDMLKNQYDNTL